MIRATLHREDGLQIAQALKESFQKKNYPVRDVFLFGSVAHNRAHAHSDIDIAIFCDSFLKSRHEENVRFLLESKHIDVRIQTICLRPEDMKNRYFALAKEVQEHGIRV